MQSIRQYRRLHESAKEWHAGQPPNTNEPRPLEGGIFPPGSSSDTVGTEEEEKGYIHIVEWDGPRDPANPRNWTLARRSFVLFILWINVFAMDWAGSADAQGNTKIADAFHVSEEAETLSPALYNFGIGIGALFAGPISETVGRNPIYIGSRVINLCFLLGVALAPNFGAQCAFRFLAGLGGSILLAIHAASVADLFDIRERTIAWPVIALASFYGPALSPLCGAWIDQSDLSWRWLEWIAVIISGSTLLLTLFFLPETFAPIILTWKAKHLRNVTGDQRHIAELDRQHSLLKRLRTSLLRAWHMLTREPVVPLLGFWLVLVYITVYGFLQGFTYIFGDTYGFEKGLIGTCFAAIITGVSLWWLSVPIYYRLYNKEILRLERKNGDEGKDFKGQGIPGRDLPDPEYRLWMAMPMSILLPVALFWLGWTNYSSISPWSDIAAVTVFSICWAGIYVCVYQYILDVYGIYAGSALSVVTFVRYWASGAINLISKPWYSNLGVHWVFTIIGCLAILLAPAPFFLYKYGPGIRKRSPFAGRYSRPTYERRRTGRAASWT